MSGGQLLTQRGRVVQVGHLHESTVADGVDDVLGYLEGPSGGGDVEPLLDRSAGVDRAYRDAVAIDQQFLDVPVEVGDGVEDYLQGRDDIVAAAGGAVQQNLVVDELVHAVEFVIVERLDVAPVPAAQFVLRHDHP